MPLFYGPKPIPAVATIRNPSSEPLLINTNVPDIFIPTNSESKRGLKSSIEAFGHLVEASESPRLLGYVRYLK